MTHAAHTPGPWQHRQHSGNDSRVIHDGTAPIGMAYEMADARLIAEAPAMLEALRDAVARLAGFIGSSCECDNTHEANGTQCCLCEYTAILARIDGEA